MRGHSDIGTTTIYITLANIDVENGMKALRVFYNFLCFFTNSKNSLGVSIVIGRFACLIASV